MFIKIVKIIFNLIYNIFKIRKNKDKVVMLSRQSNEPSVDFQILEKAFEKKGFEVIVFAKKIEKGLLNKIVYIMHLIKGMYHLANSKYCIVDSYSIIVSILKHKEELKVMQIWHALGAIKKFGYQSIDKKEGRNGKTSKAWEMHKNYDYVIAPSLATSKFYQDAFNISKKNIKILGMPRIDYLKELIEKKPKGLLKEYSMLKEKKTILYVPTFRKNKKVDLNKIIKCINQEKYNLIIRLHPLDDWKVDPKNSIDSKYSTYEIMSVSDYVITDYSAIAFEAAVMNKQTYFYVYDYEKYSDARGLNIDLLTEMSSVTSKDIKCIAKKIEEEDYDYVQFNKFKEKYIETIRENNTEKIIRFLLEREKLEYEENSKKVSYISS